MKKFISLILVFANLLTFAQNISKIEKSSNVKSVVTKKQVIHLVKRDIASKPQNLCAQQNISEILEAGFETSDNVSTLFATDITVPPNIDFTFNKVKLKFIVNTGVLLESAHIRFYNNAIGVPGKTINDQPIVIPTTQVVIGDIDGIYDVIEVEFQVDPVLLKGRSIINKTYWISVMPIVSSGTAAVLATTENIVGLPQAYTVDDGENWMTQIIYDFLYTFEGDCSPIIDGEFPPVGNDICSGATAISCGETFTGSTADNTSQGGSVYGAQDEWFKYKGNGVQQFVTISLCNSSYDTRLLVFDSCGGSVIAQSDDTCGVNAQLTLTSDGTSTYHFAVSGFNSQDAGNFEIKVSCIDIPNPPANDHIENAINVTSFPYTDPLVGLTGATVENGEPEGCPLGSHKAVWYHFKAGTSGTATATISNPLGESTVAFYLAPNGNAIETDISAADPSNEACSDRTSASIQVIAGQDYYIAVSNTLSNSDIVINGDFSLATGENKIQGFSYYPNPATEDINLQSLQPIDKVSIYNMAGQKMSEKMINAKNARLNISKLAVGTYLLKVKAGGKDGVYKIIKK